MSTDDKQQPVRGLAFPLRWEPVPNTGEAHVLDANGYRLGRFATHEIARQFVAASNPSAVRASDAVAVLIELHRLMDFEQHICPDDDFKYSDCSAINAAFDKAYALVAQSLEQRESSPQAEGSRSSECNPSHVAASKQVCYGIFNAKGQMHISESCIAEYEETLVDELESVQSDDPDDGWHIAPMFIGSAPSASGRICEWREDVDGNYQTGCGNSFFFETGDAIENRAKWCLYCGGELRQHNYVEPIIDEEGGSAPTERGSA